MKREQTAVRLERHPLAVAVEHWEANNRDLFDVSTISSDPKYLRNRLLQAFMDGYEKGRARQPGAPK